MNHASPPQGSFVPPPGWLDPPADESGSAGAGFLLVVTLLAAVLRFYGLTAQSLWVDEMMTWNQIRPGQGLDFLVQIRDVIQGPLYHAVVWPLVRLLEGEAALRLPAAVAGTAAVPLLGILAARWCGRSAGRLAALLLAINPFHLWYSQEGRGYSFLVLAAILAGLAYDRFRRDEGSVLSALWLGLSGFLVMTSNLAGSFLWAAMGLGWVLGGAGRSGRSGRGWAWGLGAFALAALLTSPWLLQAAGIWAVDRVLPGAATGEALRGESTFSALALPYTVFSFFYGNSLGPSLAELHALPAAAVLRENWFWYLAGAVPVAAAGLLGLVAAGRRRWTLVGWILVPALVLGFLAVRNVKPWNSRYLAMCLPWFLILVAAGMVRLPRRPGLVAGTLLLGLTLWSVAGYYWNGQYAKEDVRDAAAFLEAANRDGSPVLVPTVTAVFEHYYRGPGRILDTYGRSPLHSGEDAEAFIAAELGDVRRCWLVEARSWYFDPGDLLGPALADRGTLEIVHRAPGVKVFRWERRRPE